MNDLFVAEILCILICTVSMSAKAALLDRGGGLIYDSDIDVTWLANPNDTDMTWYEAMDWVANLDYYDTVRGTTWSDWRLPATLVPDPSCDLIVYCTGGELEHLYYIENANNSGLFSPSPEFYWSATEYDTDTAYAFSWFAGERSTINKSLVYPRVASSVLAWAVRDGDVATVPITPSLWLLGSGLIGLIRTSRRKVA